MKTCENCGCEHNGTYGSGRFCSIKCSRAFSTKAKRQEINEKVSKKLKGRGHDKIEKKCKYCGNLFKVDWNRRYQECCSKSCRSFFTTNKQDVKSKISKGRINNIINGKVNDYGTKMIYRFNNVDIRCDSKIEYSCLDYFEKLGATSMERCSFYIEYIDGDVLRRFNPDFKIILNDKIHIVEAKSYQSIKSVNEKWRRYNELSVLKKEMLENYCKLNNFESFWFTKDLNLKFYLEL